MGFPTLRLGGKSWSLMLNQRVKPDPVGGLRYRGLSPSMPSVSRFRSGYMPSGVTANLSESDMDTCSDSDGECYGARYSPQASPQDDKLPNGGAKYGAFVYDESSPLSELSSTPPRRRNGAVLEKKLKAGTNFAGISLQSRQVGTCTFYLSCLSKFYILLTSILLMVICSSCYCVLFWTFLC